MAIIAVSASGCTRGFDMSIAGTLASPVLTLDTRARFSKEKVCLEQFDVSEESVSPSVSDRVVWAARTPERLTCVAPGTLEYARAPVGFKIHTEAAALKAGVVYRVHGSGLGWWGNARFVYSRGKWSRVS